MKIEGISSLPHQHFICLRFKFATKQMAIQEKDVSLSQQNIQQASTWPQHKGNK